VRVAAMASTALADQVIAIEAAVQNYAWGVPGASSLVATIFANNSRAMVDATRPFAELWIGTHPSGPARVVATGSTLAEYLTPSGVTMPYLLKILSVGKALSIQAHPDKALAEKLHASRPDVYKDDNHKPEMSVALTRFEAMCNFRKAEEIAADVAAVPEFAQVVGEQACKALASVNGEKNQRKAALREVFDALMRRSVADIADPLAALGKRLASKQELTRSETLFMKLADQYPGDVGCFSAFLLNYMVLEPGQAFFMAANEPHAYLLGQCVEIMACSDNVVRAGLTPKFKDVETLVNMLTYADGAPTVMNGIKVNDFVKVYQPPVEEFQLEKVELPPAAQTEVQPSAGPGLVLVIGGEGWLAGVGSSRAPLYPGSIYYVQPGAQISFVASATNSGSLLLFRAGVNEAPGQVTDTTANPIN